MWFFLLLVPLALSGCQASLPQARAPTCKRYELEEGGKQYISYYGWNTHREEAWCVEVRCPEENAVELTCHRFRMKFTRKCKGDYLSVGAGAYSGTLGTFCGRFGPKNLVTGGPYLQLTLPEYMSRPRVTQFNCTTECKRIDALTTTTTTQGPTTSRTTTTTASTPSTAATPSPKPFDCRCGEAGGTSRIVNGNDVLSKSKYPWMVSVVARGSSTPTCGATLIDSRYLVTTASCAQSCDFLAVFEEHIWTSVTPVFTREVERCILHESYDEETGANNIAIIKLKERVNFNNKKIAVRPVCLPDTTADFAGDSGVIAGWGRTGQYEEQSPQLQEGRVTIDDLQPRADVLRAQSGPDQPDVCEFDEGGPLMVAREDGRYVLAGVIPDQTDCGAESPATEYAAVQHYLPWITSSMNKTTPDCSAP